MKKQNVGFLWSDNWWIEENEAWFVSGENNAIFRYDMCTKETSMVVTCPEEIPNGFRYNPRCIKSGNDVFCMPDKVDSIWVYAMDKKQYYQIEVANPDKKRIAIANFWRYDKKIYAVSIGLGKIIEINIKDRKIDNYYDLCREPEERIGRSIMVGTVIYSVSLGSNCIYQFNVETKEINKAVIPEAAGKLFTISYDGKDFWLSGFRREIYVWNKERNSIKVINSFPKQFGLYDIRKDRDKFLDTVTAEYSKPAFYDSVVMSGYAWFIPYQTNKIICVDVKTHEMRTLEIEGEEETLNGIVRRNLAYKYILEGTKDNRYIYLFSIKNGFFYEIDTLNGKVRRATFSFDVKNGEKILQIFSKNIIYHEELWMERDLFELQIFCMSDQGEKDKKENIGDTIQRIMLQ